MEVAAELMSERDKQDIENKKDLHANVDFKMVSFSLAGKDYAIDIMKVKEIAKSGRCTYVPNTSSFVLGVYNLRGDIIPIVDFRVFFNIPVPERHGNQIENVIILSNESQTFGVVVDAIDKVIGIQRSRIQPPHPLFDDINIKYIYGIVENKDRLYVLLDIDTIFSLKSMSQDLSHVEKAARAMYSNQKMTEPETNSRVDQKEIPPKTASIRKEPVSIQTKNTEQQLTPSVASVETPVDYKNISIPLNDLKKFSVSKANISWVQHRLKEWTSKHENKIANASEAEAFLAPFYSKHTGTFWSKDYADAIFAALPKINGKQITVWNPGCGKGYETYCLACILKKCYPDTRIRIYAQDIDLFNISSAPTLIIPEDEALSWFAENISATASGSKTFTPDIKEMILFEYHDCLNVNTLPIVDMIFCRDVVSFLQEPAQNILFEEFKDKLKSEGVLILGENESVINQSAWTEKMINNIVVYQKH